MSKLPIVVIICLSLLGGCRQQQESMFERYIVRLSNVLDVEPLSLPEPLLISLPDTRDLYREPSPLYLGLLDSYQLRQCGLFQLIAERNSILGKVADPFRRYDYHVSFVQLAKQCLNEQQFEPEINRALTEAIEVKTLELTSVHFSNLIWSSQAIRRQLTGVEWLAEGDMHNSAPVVDAFEALTAAFQGSYMQEWAVIPELVPHQEVLEKQALVGNLVYSMSNASHYLSAINLFLTQNLDTVRCGQGVDSTQYRYLNNVLNQQYIQTIQPYLADLNQLYYQLSEYTQFLSSLQLSYQLDLESVHDEFQSKVIEHVTQWQTLSRRCEAATS
ncbi:DUF3080 family protein [Vibrio sp. WXL210]|uniref:DUF3080 family protein n=1 Tax=Vibrio sp. WXL210 TaxID=3450709 RepID=UPI003EC4CBF3